MTVFQLSAQFPGPTAPRDFITLLLTCERSTTNPDFPRPLRQWIVVSKPCNHSDCPPRQGIIRGQYESIELIREVPAADPPSKLSASTPNLTQEKKAEDSTVKSSASDAGANDDEPPVAIEWLMVTRSDPGGSVPRFMIEKGTPPGIVNDAGKFLTWARRRSGDDPEQAEKALEEDAATNSADAAAPSESTKGAPAELGRKTVQSEVSESWGLWGMVTGAVGAASSVLKWQFSGADEDAESDSESLSGSDTSSVHSFASALEGSLASDQGSKSQAVSNSDVKSDEKSQAKGQHHKELRRLEERRRKLDEKVSKIAEEREAKILAGKEKEAAALAKSREKHEKEIAKQEVKYKNQLQKIEKRREQAEHKAEQRRKKAAEREQATNLKLEIDKTRAERDVALKKVQLLEAQVEQLQVENSKLKTAAGDGGSSSSNASGKPESSKS